MLASTLLARLDVLRKEIEEKHAEFRVIRAVLEDQGSEVKKLAREYETIREVIDQTLLAGLPVVELDRSLRRKQLEVEAAHRTYLSKVAEETLKLDAIEAAIDRMRKEEAECSRLASMGFARRTLVLMFN